MELLQTLRSELLAIDFRNPKILLSIATIIFNPIYWNVIGRLEYHTRLFTKLSGGNAKLPCQIFAFTVFTLGLFRDYLFHDAVDSFPKSSVICGPIVKSAGLALMILGNVFVLSSMYVLGITGTYLGDHFGILMKAKVTGFPFNVFEHPMYQGASMVFLGYALWRESFIGLVLGNCARVVYAVAGEFESGFTSMIYEKANQKTSRKAKSS